MGYVGPFVFPGAEEARQSSASDGGDSYRSLALLGQAARGPGFGRSNAARPGAMQRRTAWASAPPTFEVVGSPTEDRRIVAEGTQRCVVTVAHQPAETGLAAALWSVSMKPCEQVIVIDGEPCAERFATDCAAPSLGLQDRRYLHPRKPLALCRRLARIGRR